MRALLAAAATVAIAGAAGCSRRAELPDVVLVTIDTLRADHCSSYGYPIATTPNLDRVGAAGIRFAQAYAETATTSPSHAVLLTGRHFRTLGLMRNGEPLPDEAVTLAERMKEAGYATAAFVSSFPLLGTFGFAQGFDHYDDRFEIEGSSVGRRKPGRHPTDRHAEATATLVEAWLSRRRDDRPLFLWVHFVDPHRPYRAPRDFVADWPPGTGVFIPRYDGEVRYADEELGRVLASVESHAKPGRGQLVIVTSDHGEGLGDHDWMAHGINLYEEAVRVPLVARWDGHLPKGTVVAEPVALVDVAPGILSLLGIEREAHTFTDGRDLFAPGDPDRPIFLQRREYRSTHDGGRHVEGEMTAIVKNGSKFILAPAELRRELYDLVADPHELTDLLAMPDGERRAPPAEAAAREARAKELERQLADWRAEFPSAARPDAPLDPETLRALRSLGYAD